MSTRVAAAAVTELTAGVVGLNATMAYEDEVVTSQLCEAGLALGTIVEAKEGSTSGESDHDTPTGTTTPTPVTPTDKPVSEGSEGRRHKDVDGGWAWVVLVCIFLVFAITSGQLYSTGLYYVQMLVEYGHSRSYTAWMGSLANAFFMLGGPLSSAFIQWCGCRAALMAGSVCMTLGYIMCAFTNSLEMLFFTYGIVVASGGVSVLCRNKKYGRNISHWKAPRHRSVILM